MAVQTASDRVHCWLATFDEAEVALNGRLGCMHKLITATATATSAMLIGIGERADDGHDYFRKALALLNKMIKEEYRVGYELVTVENS